jgi:mRNA-degrading endonuclease RelE of RelBE toxin-antitoxin system
MAYSPFVARKLVTVAETPLFVRQAEAIWGAAERDEFVTFIAGNPAAGDVIPDTGGVRKIRWSRAGTGKRGGVRVIYFYHDETRPLYLLMVYAKARQENLTPDEKRTVRTLVAVLKS